MYEQQKEKPTLLSSISHDEYHKAEEEFLRQLTAYAKKQFFPVIQTHTHMHTHTHTHTHTHAHTHTRMHAHAHT